MTTKEKYNSVIDYFKLTGDTKAREKAENKPAEYYAENNVYDILEEPETK